MPPEIAERATVHPNGEVSWRIEYATDAVHALGAAGRVVLGLDIRDYADNGHFIDVAWSSYEPSGMDDAAQATTAALEVLARPEVPGEVVLVTWTT